MGRNWGSTHRKTPLKLRLRRTLNLFPISNHLNPTTKKIQKLKKRKSKADDDDDLPDSGTAATSKPHLDSCSMSHPLSHSKQCSASALMQNTDPSNTTDAIIITSLPTLPFCCHEHLLSMDGPQLGLVAEAMNERLPRALRISEMSAMERGEKVGMTMTMRDVREAIEFLVGIKSGGDAGSGDGASLASSSGPSSGVLAAPTLPQHPPSAIPRPQRPPSIPRPTSPSSPPTNRIRGAGPNCDVDCKPHNRWQSPQSIVADDNGLLFSQSATIIVEDCNQNEGRLQSRLQCKL